MSFGTSFASSAGNSLREILGQAIQTKEAKKRYAEYFAQQEQSNQNQYERSLALQEEKARLAAEKAQREADAKKAARYGSTALGYLDPRTGGFVPGFVGGAPANAQTVYAYDTGKEGLNKILAQGLAPVPVTVPIDINGQTFMGSVSEALRAQEDAERARNNKDRASIARDKKGHPVVKPASANEEMARLNLLNLALQDAGFPTETSVTVGDKAQTFPIRRPAEVSELADLLSQGYAPGEAVKMVLASGVEEGSVSGTVPGAADVLSDVDYDGEKFTIPKEMGDGPISRVLGFVSGNNKDATEGEALKYLVSKGIDVRVAKAYLKQIKGVSSTTQTTAADDELGY